jgi:hypothetical protein
MAGLTFIIPVRNQANAKDWSRSKVNLRQTAASIAAQTSSSWNAFVVANHGADLPELPRNFSDVRVDFPPNLLHDMESADRETVYRAFRQDKGQRVLAGLLAARPKGHVMIVDDDDFVSRRLADYVARNPQANGWFIRKGYVWSDGGSLVLRHDAFSHLCGTSHIIRADLFRIPDQFDAATPEYIQDMLGSHVHIADELARQGAPLMPLPFRGAIYRIGHAGAHSGSRSIWQTFFAHPHGIRSVLSNALRLGYLSPEMRREFFAAQT